jgi:hypothetical protein
VIVSISQEIRIKQIALDSVVDYDKLPDYEKNLPSFWKYGETIEETAYMAYRAKFSYHAEYEHFALMGEDYFDAAYFLLEICSSDNTDHQADRWIAPVLFDIAQGIELYLKAIIVCLYIYQNDKEIDTETGWHDLTHYYKKVEELMNILSTSKSIPPDFLSALHIVKNYIENLYAKSSDPTFVRYPTNKKHNPHFYITERQNVTIDLSLLKEQTIVVYKMLDYIFWHTKELIDAKK